MEFDYHYQGEVEIVSPINTNLVSIITPVYNSEKYLSQTIDSVIQQTYTDWELILIDDCSEDGSLAIARGYRAKDNRIKIIQMPSNGGMASAINEGCRIARGRYIAFLDSDDLWHPLKLSLQLDFMKKGGHAITCTSYVQFNSDNGKEGRLFRANEKVDYRRVLLDCPVGHSTVMYDVSILGVQVVPNIRKRSDDALWLQILKTEKYIWGLQDTLVKYRLRDSSLSRNKITLVHYHWILYREIERISVLRSVFHIVYWGIIKVLRIK